MARSTPYFGRCRLGKQEEATEILRALVSDPMSTLAAVAWAKALLDRK